MSFSTPNGAMKAKAGTLDHVLLSIRGEAEKEAVSHQETMRALSMAAHAWLQLQDEEVRTNFFAGIEAAVSAGVAKKIERHPLRPAAVGPIVEATRKEAERQREARKAEDDLARERRERAKLAELKRKYKDDGAASAPEPDA